MIIYDLEKKQHATKLTNTRQLVFATTNELNHFEFINDSLLKDVHKSARPVIRKRNLTLYSFKVYSTYGLKLDPQEVFLITHENLTLVILDDYHEFLVDLETIMLEQTKQEHFMALLLKLFLDDLYTSFSEIEDHLIDIEDGLSSGSLKNIDLDLLSSIKHDCMMAEKNMRRLKYITQDIMSLKSDTNHISSLVSATFEYSNHITSYSQHLIILYNSLISEKTNTSINRLTIFTVFATPITILSGI